ncbi:MAG: NAD(P)-dependent oxidoreductase, partial [Casimicrobiaceae bacterium]
GVELDAAGERGIVVAHSPGANASSVADLAIGLLIASVRRMVSANAYLLNGEWERRGRRNFEGPGLTGRRLGIYGLGSIGLKIAARAAALEMEVGYFNRRARIDVAYAYHPSLLTLATWADVLMIAVRADAGNRHSVDAAVLKALGPDGHVVNIARGAVIDEQALIDALRDGTIAGAGLDVYEFEPAVPEALRQLPHLALTPHIGGETYEARTAMGDMVLANLEAFFAGRPVPCPVPLPAG